MSKNHENLEKSQNHVFFTPGSQSLEKTTEVAYCPAGQFLVNDGIFGAHNDFVTSPLTIRLCTTDISPVTPKAHQLASTAIQRHNVTHKKYNVAS